MEHKCPSAVRACLPARPDDVGDPQLESFARRYSVKASRMKRPIWDSPIPKAIIAIMAVTSQGIGSRLLAGARRPQPPTTALPAEASPSLGFSTKGKSEGQPPPRAGLLRGPRRPGRGPLLRPRLWWAWAPLGPIIDSRTDSQILA